MTIAALYVEHGGIYYDLPGVQPWGLPDKDARQYNGPYPVIAHPPCARWCKLAKFVESQHPRYKVGEDGGCFASALRSVRKWGGVLEHPAFSLAWSAYDLQIPPTKGWSKCMYQPNEWVAEVAQGNYGHRAQKMTWLLYVGKKPPIPLMRSNPTKSAVISSCTRRGNGTFWRRSGEVERLSKKQRNATPVLFRDLLLSIVKDCRC